MNSTEKQRNRYSENRVSDFPLIDGGRSEEGAERFGGNDIPGGWTKAETAAIHRWITADPDIMKDWQQCVTELLRGPESFPTRRAVRDALARELRDEAGEECCRLASGLLRELLGIALARVNWPELSEALLSECENQGTPKNPQPENRP